MGERLRVEPLRKREVIFILPRQIWSGSLTR